MDKEKKFENLSIENNPINNENDDNIVYIKGDAFIKGNAEEFWDQNYNRENIIDFVINDGDNKLKLATYATVPKEPKAIVIYFHGMGGYMKFSAFMAKKICEEEIGVYGYDYRGHGKSEGKRSYFNSVETYINDSLLFIAKVKELHPNIPFFLGGNSLGGQIAYKISLRNPGVYKGVFLFAPALKPLQNCFTYYFAVCAGSIFPCCGVNISDPTSGTKSAYSLERMEKDPYIEKGRTPLASIKAILQGMDICPETFKEYKENFIVFLGGNEKFVSIDAIFDLMKYSPSNSKKMYHYERMYHNILIEDECFDVINKVVSWLKLNIK